VNPQKVFTIRKKREFEKIALQVFRWQAEKNHLYKKYLLHLGIPTQKVKRLEQIPFLPVEFFKTHPVITLAKPKPMRGNKKKNPQRITPVSDSVLFLSSGTSRTGQSKHYVSDIHLYERSFRKCFDLFYGDIKKYALLAFLPSYYENKNSSLLYMINSLVAETGRKESRFYRQHEKELLFDTLRKLLSKKQKVILFGVSHALLDLAESSCSFPQYLGNGNALSIIETGGMKGKREELTRESLHKALRKKFHLKNIHSEYGMTELLSQAYSKGKGIFISPPWMRVLVRDPNDPWAFFPHGKTGALNIIDLANIHSSSFIATQDIGRSHTGNSFEVLGRLENSDLRGCNLLISK
jgi:Acyl-protein synthetase, LuxE